MSFDEGNLVEIERLVSLFHQDYDLMEGPFSNVMKDYVRSISKEKEIKLRNEIVSLLSVCNNNREIIENFYLLGAEFVPECDNYIQALRDFVESGTHTDFGTP